MKILIVDTTMDGRIFGGAQTFLVQFMSGLNAANSVALKFSLILSPYSGGADQIASAAVILREGGYC